MSDNNFETQTSTCGSGENGVPDDQLLDKHASLLRKPNESSIGLIAPLAFALFVGGTLFWAGHSLALSSTSFIDNGSAMNLDANTAEGNQNSESTDSKSSRPSAFTKGKKLYNTPGACVTCHQANGQGLEAAHFPPLANSEWATGSEEILTRIVLHGVQGPLKVGDKEYGVVPMVPTIWKAWTDEDIAAVITYIRNEWGNEAPEVSAETVKRIREKEGDRTPWTTEELQGL